MNSEKPGYREFMATKDDKTLIRLSVRHPDKKEVDGADLEYSGTFNRSLLGGLPTQAKMIRSLRENEVISHKDEEEMGQLSQDLRVLGGRILKEKFADDAAKKVVQDEITKKTARLNRLNREINEMVAHTADAKASEAHRNYLIACVVERVDGPQAGDRLYDDVDGLLGEKDGALLNRVLYEYMMSSQDLPSDWENLMKDEKDEDEKTEEPKVPDAVKDAAAAATPPVTTFNDPPGPQGPTGPSGSDTAPAAPEQPAAPAPVESVQSVLPPEGGKVD